MERSRYSDMFTSRLPWLSALLYLNFNSATLHVNRLHPVMYIDHPNVTVGGIGTYWSFYSNLPWWRRWWMRRSGLITGVLHGNHLFDGYMYNGTLYITQVRHADTLVSLYS